MPLLLADLDDTLIDRRGSFRNWAELDGFGYTPREELFGRVQERFALADSVDVEGVRKPDAAIFERAAERCGEPLAGAWMAGDNPDADIRGAHELGLSTIWLRHDRDWEATDFEPTLSVDTLEEALAQLAHVP